MKHSATRLSLPGIAAEFRAKASDILIGSLRSPACRWRKALRRSLAVKHSATRLDLP